jgi:transcriptional regulator with XRE-family HTH domain
MVKNDSIEASRERRQRVKAYLEKLQMDISQQEGRIITKRELAEHLGILETTLGNWFKMVSLPSGESLRAAGERYPELYIIVGQLPSITDKKLETAVAELVRSWPVLTEDSKTQYLRFLSGLQQGQTNETTFRRSTVTEGS